MKRHLSGHEPAHGGFVGTGMLDAAVLGPVYTSPTPDEILKAIEAVDAGKGVFMVIKNYTGDVMNFEMAGKWPRIEVYFAPIPGGLAGTILKTRKEETPKIFVDNNASTSRKRFTIAHELGHCVERFRDSDSPNQKIPGCFGFSDESMVSDEKILGGIMPIGSS